MAEKVKECAHCKIINPIENFSKDKKSKDGHVCLCKDCVKSYNRNYYTINKEKIIIRTTDYYNVNKENVLEYQKLYSKTEMGKLVQSRNRHKRKLNEGECTLTLLQWNSIIAEQNNCCNHCGRRFDKSLKPTKDHIIPVSHGGSLTYENTQALCRSCNSRKGKKFEHELKYLGD